MEAKEILDTMLGYLGFVADIQEIETEGGRQLQVFTAESEFLIGHNGATLEDLQFLLNRILQTQDRNAPRVQVDVRGFGALRAPCVGTGWSVLATGVGADEAPAGTVVESPIPKMPAADSAMATGQRKTCFRRFNRFIAGLPSCGWEWRAAAPTSPGRPYRPHCRRVSAVR